MFNWENWSQGFAQRGLGGTRVGGGRRPLTKKQLGTF